MLRIWRHGDPAIPPDIAFHTYRGGDEDFVIVGHTDDQAMFTLAVERMDTCNLYSWDDVVKLPDGTLIFTVCHA